jgi:hypothetical protein
MDLERRCAKCGEPWPLGRSRTQCPVCGAEWDWREPHAADVVDNDDEEVIENTAAVEPPAS